MFHLLRDRSSPGIAPEQVVAVIESINNPNISIPDKGTEPTKCYIVGMRMASGGFTVFLYMHMLDSNQSALFAADPIETGIEGYPSMEGEAIQFAESMGFMLDNLNFRALPAEEQARLSQSLPFFFEEPPKPQHRPGGALDAIDQVPSATIPGIPADAPAAAAEAAPALSESEAAAVAKLLAAF